MASMMGPTMALRGVMYRQQKLRGLPLQGAALCLLSAAAPCRVQPLQGATLACFLWQEIA
jgi:hypothetical protein